MSKSRPASWLQIRALYASAIKLPEADREQWLESEYHDPDILASVRQLLEAADNDLDIENMVGTAAADLVTEGAAPQLTKRIGSYQATAVLGSGGMGTVYLAERADDQFDHEVAIKVLHASSHDPYFEQRFRAERQVLAKFDHPNICKLLDGGELDDGAPFLVMEYLRGLPIDEYCDQQQLGITARLKLFQKICLAVDYAHRQLVVHRDIKPSNILVDETGEPKLLDFGIARLLDAGNRANAPTVDGRQMLTPEFASPEQVRGEPVATATDIYSLGVLLYRLLCGQGPYTVRSDLPSELARAILDDEPGKPSRSLTPANTAALADDIGARRGTSLPKLRHRLQGDLDNITLKALRKLPEQRYASARDLHDDIENFLGHRPVAARPASLGYRARKFALRHRVVLSVASVPLLFLSASVFEIIQQRDRAERAALQSEQVSGFLAHLFASASPERSQGDAVTAKDLLAEGVANIEQLSDQPAVQAELLRIMGSSYKWLGYNVDATPLLRRSVALYRQYRPEDRVGLAQALNVLADNQRILMHLDEAETLFSESLALYRARHGNDHQMVANAYNRLGDVYRMQGRLQKSRESLERAVASLEQAGLIDESIGIDTRGNLALVYDDSGMTAAAVAMATSVVAASRAVDGDQHPNTIIRIANLGLMNTKLGDYETALQLSDEAYAYGENQWVSDLRSRSWISYHRADVLRELGRLDEAEALHRKAVELQRAHSGEATARYSNALRRFTVHYIETGDLDAAQATLDRAIVAANNASTGSARETGRCRIEQARIDNLRGEHAAAFEESERALAASESIGHRYVMNARLERAISLSGLGRNADASAGFAALDDDYQAMAGDDQLPMLPLLIAAARHHRTAGEHAIALRYAERANALGRGIRPQTAPRAAWAAAEYALTRQAADQADEASTLD